MIRITVADLHKGDIARFTETGEDCMLTAKYPHSSLSGLYSMEFTPGGEVTMSAETPVWAVSQWRIVTIDCFLCKEAQHLRYDKAMGNPPRLVICTPCDKVTTEEAVASMVEQRKTKATDTENTE